MDWTFDRTSPRFGIPTAHRLDMHVFGIPNEEDLTAYVRGADHQTVIQRDQAVTAGRALVSLDDLQQIVLYETQMKLERQEGDRVYGLSQQELGSLQRDGRLAACLTAPRTRQYVMRMDWCALERLLTRFIGPNFGCLGDSGVVAPGDTHRWHFYPFHPGNRLVMLVKSGGLIYPE